MSERQIHSVSMEIAGRTLTLEAGRFAEQANGAVVVRYGDTMLLATAVASKEPRADADFFPLSVDYEEKMYAAGRIPGSYFRREGKPTDAAILISRVVDRPLRPLFPEDMRNEVQVLLTALSSDQENYVDMLGIIAASAALMISDIPWNGPVAGVRIGLIDGQLVINPTAPQMENSILDLRVAGTAQAINMVECAADEVPEDTMLAALKLAHEAMQPAIALQEQMRAEIGKPKAAYASGQIPAEVTELVDAFARERVRQILIETTERQARNDAVEALQAELEAHVTALNADRAADAQIPAKAVKSAFENVMFEEVRRRILVDGVRPDGRSYTEIRPLAAEAGVLPRVHGSGLFKRGQTQVLTVATLGTPRDSQELEGLLPEERKRYLHHYNFPPFSTGETAPQRGPKRREIGHGALAEAALRAMIPDEDVFPYTIRLVSEVMSSNGSTSMASVCGSTLALMDAGVPIKRPVAGIAMGLISDGERVAVLTDIQGLEDHFGDMDFKVAGTTEGITALQMDIKITGVTDDIMARALEQARQARVQVLDVMLKAISKPRTKLSDYAPRMVTIKINTEKIGAVIGPGGKTIRGLQDRHSVKIDIEDDGTIFIAGADGPSVERAVDEIRGMTEEAELGRIYTGKIVRIEPYGVFVEFLPGRDGMVHISQLADRRVERIEDEFNIGDEIMVMVTDVTGDGKVRLSRQAVLEGWTAEEARSKDRRPSGGDRGERGGRGGDRGGRGGRGGEGDRRR